MRRPFDAFLKNYDSGDTELFLKARFIMRITLAVILATAITILHFVWSHGSLPTVLIQVAAVLAMIGALGVLTRGHYAWAIHIIFIAGFSSLWVVMFVEPPTEVLAKVDSIALVIGLSSAMGVAFFRTRRPILIYFAANFFVFLMYLVHLKTGSVLPADAIREYAVDNGIALVFVFFIAFNAVTINRRVLSALKDELVERKRAETLLSESERKLADHLKNTPVGSIFWDLEFRVVEWNPSAERIFGFSRQEVMNRQVTGMILTQEMKRPVAEVFDDLISGRGGERSINENITKGGKRIVCDWYNSVIRDAEGRIVGAASLVNDITEKVRTQELIIQSEKMMSVGGLAAGMAHEVNNPLSGMIQNAQLIRQRLTEDVPANRKTAEILEGELAVIFAYARERGILAQLDHIEEAGGRAVKVIENMLSFSRKSDSVREAVDMAALIDQTLALASHDHVLNLRFTFRNIEVVREYEAGLPKIFCERTKVQQVLLNLFRNASDSMNEKDYSDEDKAPRLFLRIKKSPGLVCIEVEDNGTGIPPEICAQVFTPFFTTKKAKGTGLGLSISHYIITEDHGGEMAVDSEPGRGTRFTIRLPLRAGL